MSNVIDTEAIEALEFVTAALQNRFGPEEIVGSVKPSRGGAATEWVVAAEVELEPEVEDPEATRVVRIETDEGNWRRTALSVTEYRKTGENTADRKPISYDLLDKGGLMTRVGKGLDLGQTPVPDPADGEEEGQ